MLHANFSDRELLNICLGPSPWEAGASKNGGEAANFCECIETPKQKVFKATLLKMIVVSQPDI